VSVLRHLWYEEFFLVGKTFFPFWIAWIAFFAYYGASAASWLTWSQRTGRLEAEKDPGFGLIP
jgi:hypothetical protein